MYLWVTPEELDGDGDSPFALEACETASFILYALSGRKYTGYKTVTETYECSCRLVDTRLLAPGGTFPGYPLLVDSHVVNLRPCDCNPLAHTRLRLRGRPLRGVHKVVSGGVELSPGDYQVVNYSTLQAAPGGSFDPCGAVVTYSYGAEPPTAGRRAARNLAEQLAAGWSGDGECSLPDRVTSVSRQGVSYTILDEQSFLDDLRTGIYSVDLFLRAVNPDRARKPARVLSPDMARAVRSTPVATDPRADDLVVTPGDAFHKEWELGHLEAEFISTEGWEPHAQVVSAAGITLAEIAPAKFTVTSDTLELDLDAGDTAGYDQSGVFELYALNPDGPTVVSLLTSTVFIQQ